MKNEENKLYAVVVSIGWLLFGPIYLILALLVDMYFYSKVLFDYNEDCTEGGMDEQ